MLRSFILSSIPHPTLNENSAGVVEESFLYIMHGAKPKQDRQGIWRDPKMLEKSMAGLGTRDQQLIYRWVPWFFPFHRLLIIRFFFCARLIRAHWNPSRFEAIKDPYKRRYGKTLKHRVKGETSDAYRDLLVAVVRSSEGKN